MVAQDLDFQGSTCILTSVIPQYDEAASSGKRPRRHHRPGALEHDPHGRRPTVKTQVGRVLAKTQSRDRVHPALFAYRTGLVSRAPLVP